MAIVASACAQEPPTYPLAVPHSVQQVEEELDRAIVSICWQDCDLVDALRELHEKCRLNFVWVGKEVPAPHLTMTFSMAPLSRLVDAICKISGLYYRVQADGSIQVGPEDQIADEAPPLLHRRRLRELGLTPPGRFEEGGLTARAWRERLNRESITLEMADATISEVVTRLNESVSIGLFFPSSPVTDRCSSMKCSVHWKDRPLGDALAELLEGAGLGVCHLGDRLGSILPTKYAQTRDKARVQANEHLAKTVDVSVLETKQRLAWQLPELIRMQTGQEVVLDESIWGWVRPVKLPEGKMTLRELLDALAIGNRLDWHVLGGVVYLIPR